MTSRPANLEKAFIATQRVRLLAERTRLASALARETDEDHSLAGAARLQANESEDRAQDATLAENNRTLGATLAERQSAIDRALAKIADGTYGFSDDSGEPIALARLEACPEAVRTIAEEELHEARTTVAV